MGEVMKLYIPKGSIENLQFILDMFIETHESSDAFADDVSLAKTLLDKLAKEET